MLRDIILAGLHDALDWLECIDGAAISWQDVIVFGTSTRRRHSIFSDKSSFKLHRTDGRTGMRRQQGEGHIDVCVQGADGNVGPIVIIGAWFTMVEEMTWLCWTAPWISNCTDMCCNKVYYPGHCKGHLPEQRCNAPPHTVRATRDFLENQDVEVMDWPSKRTDMKPIEHIWDQMVVHVRGMDNPASTVYPKKYAHGFVVLCFVVVM